jgi:hypothetical protein
MLYLDIETIPGQNAALHQMLQEEAEVAKAQIRPPANYKDETKIAEYIFSKQAEIDAEIDLKLRKTSFDGAYGQIVAISVAINDEVPINIYSEDWANAEPDLLHEFYDLMLHVFEKQKDHVPVVIGHNVLSFDLRFMLQRSMLHGIQPPAFIPFDAKPWDERIFDTMTRWAGVGNRVSLDKLCRVFGIPTKGSELGEEIDGSLVWDFVRSGRVADVATYCGGDVERVRMLHKRMTFATSALETDAGKGGPELRCALNALP